MLTADVLAYVRRLLNETDQAAQLVDDLEILAALSDALRVLKLKRVPDIDSSITLDPDPAPGTEAFTPELSDEQAQFLVLRATADLLDSIATGKLNRGELGVSWTSGMEQESTISAASAYVKASAGLRSELETLILIRRSSTAGTRPQ